MSQSTHPGDALPRSTRLLYVVVLGALVGLGPFTIDLYLPAFPNLAESFGASEAAIQLTLTGTTIGFGLGQLLVGPWSDKVGRRLPLLLATVVHIVASVGAALSPDIVTLGIFRVLQGVGAAGGGVVAMAMVRDLFGGRPLVRMLARLALVTSMAPIIAPLVGSQLLRFTDWRGIFVVLAVYGVLVLVAASFSIGETMTPRIADAPGHRSIGQRYKALFGDRIFVGIIIIGAMQFSGLFSYLSASSFLFQEVYGLNAQEFGLFFGLNSIGILIGNQTASRLTRIVGPQWILACTTAAQIVASAAIVIGVMLDLGFWGIVIPLFVFITSVGFAFPCVQVLALAQHGKEAGTAASLMGAFNFGIAGVISPLVGVLGIATAVPMAAIMGLTACVGTLSLWLVVRPRTVPALED